MKHRLYMDDELLEGLVGIMKVLANDRNDQKIREYICPIDQDINNFELLTKICEGRYKIGSQVMAFIHTGVVSIYSGGRVLNQINPGNVLILDLDLLKRRKFVC